MQKGNRGEWSELYTFLKLLDEKNLYAADANLQKMEDIFYPILKLVRYEATGRHDYTLQDDGKIAIQNEGVDVAIVELSDLKTSVKEIFKIIKDSSETTFEIPIASSLMSQLHADRISAGNSSKEDITLKIHDQVNNSKPEVGFSIKSMLGSPATLLNASTATNFVYKVTGITDENLEEINSIDSRSKVRDRIAKIVELGGAFSYATVDSEIFSKNLRKVETVMPEIISELLLAYYSGKGSLMSDLVSNLGKDGIKILNFDLDATDYEYKLKVLLHNIALGMVPNTAWDGKLRAHGGYIIVREDGEIVSYHVFNADEFRGYLYNNTGLETPSTDRHKFGVLYKDGDEIFFKLNLQIRFIK